MEGVSKSSAAAPPGSPKPQESNKGKAASGAITTVSKQVLVLGDGTFCFSRAYHELYPHKTLLATCYQKEGDEVASQAISQSNRRQLEQAGVRVAYGFDATNIGESLKANRIVDLRLFTTIIFNYPLAGEQQSEQTTATPSLMHKMLSKIYEHLEPDGKLVLRLIRSPRYQRLYQQHRRLPRAGFKLIKCVQADRSGKYRTLGYVHRDMKGEIHSPKHERVKYVFQKVDQADPTFNKNEQRFHSSGISSDERVGHYSLEGQYQTCLKEERIHYHMYRRIELVSLLAQISPPPGDTKEEKETWVQGKYFPKVYAKIWHQDLPPGSTMQQEKNEAKQRARLRADNRALRTVVSLLQDSLTIGPYDSPPPPDKLVRAVQLCSRASPPNASLAGALSEWISDKFDQLEKKPLNKCLHALASAASTRLTRGMLRDLCQCMVERELERLKPRLVTCTSKNPKTLSEKTEEKLRILFKYWLSDCYSLSEGQLLKQPVRIQFAKKLAMKANLVVWRIFLEQARKRTPQSSFFIKIRPAFK